MAEFRMGFEGCDERLHRRPADSHDGSRVEAFMRKRHDAKSCKSAKRYSEAAAVLPTVDTNITRRLGMGAGGGGGQGGGQGRSAQATQVWV